jgi:hypothetical protein
MFLVLDHHALAPSLRAVETLLKKVVEEGKMSSPLDKK